MVDERDGRDGEVVGLHPINRQSSQQPSATVSLSSSASSEALLRHQPVRDLEGGRMRGRNIQPLKRKAQQLQLLVWKNLLFMWRSKLWTLIQVLLPLVFFAITFTIAKYEQSDIVPAKQRVPITINGTYSDFATCNFACLINKRYGEETTILFSAASSRVNNEALNDVMVEFERRFTASAKEKIRTELVQGGVREMDRLLRGDEDAFNCGRKYAGGISVSALSPSAAQYQLWLYSAVTQMSLDTEYAYGGAFDYDHITPVEKAERYCDIGVPSLMLGMDAAIVKVMKLREEPSTLNLLALPYPSYTRSALGPVTALSAFFFIVLTTFYILHSARDIASERETGMKDYLMVMGMGRGMFFLSHILTAFLKASFGLIINCIPFFTFFPNVSVVLVLLIVCLYGLAVILIGTFIGCIMSTPTKAINVAFFVHLVLACCVLSAPSREIVFSAALRSLNPHSALSYALNSFKEASVRGEFIGVTNVGYEFSYAFTTAWAIVMLTVDIILLFTAVILVDWVLSSADSPFTWCSHWLRRTPLNVLRKEDVDGEGQDEADAVLRDKDAAIQVLNVTKSFGRTQAVDGASFKAYEGQVTVLLGHNGAGKSTTFNMITGLTSPSTGSVRICGKNLATHLSACQDTIGYCPQGNPLFKLLTVNEHLEFFARLKGVDDAVWRVSRDALLHRLLLEDKRNMLAADLSGGQKRKLCVAMALIGQNGVVLLDEPTAGMDPGARREIEKILVEQKQNSTILMTTHYTDEAELLGDRIVIMAKGRVCTSGTPTFLKEKYKMGYILTVVLTDSRERKESLTDRVEMILKRVQKNVKEAELKALNGLQIEIVLPNDKTNDRRHLFPALFADLEENERELGVKSFGLSLNSLEQVFLRVGEEADPSSNNSATVAEHVDAVMREERSNGPESALFFTRFFALLWKRLLYTRVNWSSLLIQVVVPILLIIAFSHLIRVITLIGSLFGSASSRSFLLSGLPASRVAEFTVGLSDAERQRTANIVRSAGNAKLSNVAVSGRTRAVNDWYLSSNVSRPLYSVGYGRDEAEVPSAVYNPMLLHSMPASILLADSARYTVDFTASLLMYELNNKSGEVTPDEGTDAYIQKYAAGPLSIIIFALLTSAFIAFPIVERTTKFAHQQMLTGVSSLSVWMANAVYDTLFYVAATLLFLLTFYACNWMRDALPALFVLWCFYLWASLFFFYLISHIFDSSSKASILLFIFQVVIVFVGMIIVFAAKNIPNFIPGFKIDWAGTVEIIMLYFFPSYALAVGTQRVAMFVPEQSSGYFAHSVLGEVLLYLFVFGLFNCVLFILLHLKPAQRALSHLWTAAGGIYHRVSDAAPDSEEDAEVKRERIDAESMPANAYTLLLRDVCKRFGKTLAVDHLSFGVKSKECFGLLGVNGAGKTTTFSIVTGESFPTSGAAFIRGSDVTESAIRMGYCPQFDALLPQFTGRQILELLSALHGFNNARAKAQAVLNAVGMEEHADKKTGKYSGGQKRKLSVGISILAQNNLIVLDEPTAGIDPKARRDIWTLLMAVRDRSSTALVLTSHSMDECEALCSRIGILSKGALVAIGASQTLKDKYGNSFTLTIVMNADKCKEEDVERVREEVERTFPTATMKPSHSQTLIFVMSKQTEEGEREAWSRAYAKALALAERVQAEDFCLAESSLEQTFMNIAFDEQSTNSNNSLLKRSQ